MTIFSPGDEVVFFSQENGGVWKPGVVVRSDFHANGCPNKVVRIHVGSGVHVIRHIHRCRMKLPIDVVPGNPPTFVWSQVVNDLSGECRRIEHTGLLPPSVEKPVTDLINMYKHLLRDNALLRGQVQTLGERMAAQSELLSKKAESPKKGK